MIFIINIITLVYQIIICIQNVVHFIDLMIEFMLGHMMKKLPFDQYMKCISIIHRIICYQKRNSVRLCYNWKDLWSSLITLLKFLMTYEHQLSQDMNIYDLGIQVSMF